MWDVVRREQTRGAGDGINNTLYNHGIHFIFIIKRLADVKMSGKFHV